MKRLLAVLALVGLAIGASGTAMAHGVSIGVSIGGPAQVHVAPPVVYQAPVYAPVPVVVASRWEERREWRAREWRERERREAWREREWREQQRHAHESRHQHHWR
jgi:hypothetical protein